MSKTPQHPQQPPEEEDYRVAKHLRKARISASIDIEAHRLLEQMAESEMRSPSNLINKLIYQEAERRGMELPDKAKEKP